MKIKPNPIIMMFMLAAMAFSLVACDTRPIPNDSILTLYNSNMEETKEFQPMDTMYVKVAGMKPDTFYQVSVLDADKRTITKVEARTNSEGIIEAMPLWYDMGLKVDEDDPTLPPTLVWPNGLQPAGFKVNIKSLLDSGKSTDFTQDMWIIYKKADTDTNPQPVVYSCYRDGALPAKAVAGIFYPENAFKETGTLDAAGNPDPKTKIYVKADRVPTKIGDNNVDSVDFYIIRFTGNTLTNGYDLNDEDIFVRKVEDVDVNEDGTIEGTLLWDLNNDPETVINPDQDTMAYSIVMDVDRDGVFDIGADTDEDGVSDYFIDGVDGNGSPGFIIQNTPANDVFVTIKDANGNEVNAIPESGDAVNSLYVNVDNVPMGPGNEIGIILDDPAVPGIADVRNGGVDSDVPLSAPGAGDIRYLPYVTGRELVNNGDAGSYFYTGAELDVDKPLDLIIDLNNNGVYDENDILVENAVTILNVEAAGVYKTCSNAGGAGTEQFFDETGTPDGLSVVYLNAAANEGNTYDVYVFADSDWALAPATTALTGQMVRLTGLSGNGTNPIWDLNDTPQVINPTPANNTYDIVIDNDQDGVYNSGTDDILTVVILNTETNTYPRVSYVNIASGGSFGNIWEQHWTIYSDFCDYRDVFISSGLDTNPYGAGYGVKAVFNPYFSWFCNPDPETPIPGIYYGLYVDVYIVNAETFDLSVFGHRDELNDTVDVTGRHSTLVIQPSCYNGAGMMNIWPAEMTPGRYYVIVDVNRNGRIDEGVDIIDAVKEDGTTILDDPTVVGFTVE